MKMTSQQTSCEAIKCVFLLVPGWSGLECCGGAFHALAHGCWSLLWALVCFGFWLWLPFNLPFFGCFLLGVLPFGRPSFLWFLFGGFDGFLALPPWRKKNVSLSTIIKTGNIQKLEQCKILGEDCTPHLTRTPTFITCHSKREKTIVKLDQIQNPYSVHICPIALALFKD